MKKSYVLIPAAAIVLFAGYQYWQSANRIIFKINGEAVTAAAGEMEYQPVMDISAQAIGLKAEQHGKDISDQIQSTDYVIDELKTYTLIYTAGDAQFHYELSVCDTTPPLLEGLSAYTLMQGEAFDISMLQLQATDNFDGDITDQISVEGDVDPSVPNDYELIFKVSDSSGNTAEYRSTVSVEALPMDEEPADQNQSALNIVNDPDSITVMINKQYALPDGWEPSDLVSIGGSHYLRAEAANAYQQLYQAALDSGISFNVVSSYRTQDYQRNLYDRYMASDPYNAPYYSAYPRTSEHELGLAIDISYDYALHSDLESSALGQWMAEHAHEYGWIMRYPADKTASTGYYYEAWHWRYVGIELADAIHSSGLSMEEYQ